ncbi:amino acid adenylation domain-containing protein [Salinactinospora qingdaonensis]|uniref:Amino acid adenylation domain-containing protein n=1 Tax=Salinactinospora qingdaonensis TaxID=702744 RepID=A0ABP7G4R0_9ACTN
MESQPSFPLTEIQESFYVGRVLGSGTGAQVHLEFETDGLDVARLEDSWNRLVYRTEMLRATVRSDGTQEIRDEVPRYRIPVSDLSDVSEAEQAAQLRELRKTVEAENFDPSTWPLFAIKAVLLGSDRARVHLTVDEMVADGPSVSLLLAQWYTLYRHGVEPEPPQLTFRDYVARATPSAAETDRALRYWRDKLAGADLDRPAPFTADPAGQSRERRRLSFTLPPPQWAAVQRLARQSRATPSAMLLALFAAVIGDAERPIVLTTYNRKPVHPDVARLVGPFISTAVFLAPPAGGSFGEYLRAVQRQLWRDLEHDAVSGVRAHREWSRQERSHNGDPVRVVFTSMLGSLPGADAEDDPRSWPARVDDGATLTHTPGVHLEQCAQENHDGALVLSWDIASGVIDEAAGAEAFDRLTGALCRLAAAEGDSEAAVSPEVAELVQPSRQDVTGLPLTELQSAYLVGRVGGLSGAAETKVYQEFLLRRHDVDRLERAWHRLVEHHPMMRAVVHDDGTMTVRGEVPYYTFARHDLTGLGRAEVEERLAAVAERMRRTEFEIGAWPMFALEVSFLPGGEVVLHAALDALLADARSLALLFGQLFALHDGQGEVLDAAPDRSIDHMRGLARPHGGRRDEAAAQWHDKFADLPPGPPLADTGERTHRRFDLSAWPALREHAARVGVPADILLLTAYADTLRQRFRAPFTIVVVSWDRPRGMEGSVGDFTSLAWLVVDDTLPPSFEERAREIWDRVRADLERGAVLPGLRELRQRVFRSNGELRLPVVFTRIPQAPQALGGDGVELRQSRSQTAQVALDNVPLLLDDTLVCQWDVAGDALDADQADELFSSYEHRVRALLDSPEPTLTALLERSLAAYPHRPAVWWNGEALDYAELDRRSAQLANHLIRSGCRPGAHIAVHMDRSDDLVVALVAIVRAGGVYVPIEAGTPRERVKYLIEDSGARVLVADGTLAGALHDCGAHVVCPDRDGALLAAAADTAPEVHVAADDPVYMIYTSGTTGQPKGCLNTHRGVANRLLWMQERFPLSGTDRVLQKTPCGFDVSAWEFFWPLLAGAATVVARPGGHRDPAYLARAIRENSVTVTHFVPSMLGLFLSEPSAADCSSLRYVFASGEALPVGTMRRFFEVLPEVQLHNLYGPTEAAIDVTHWECVPDWDEASVPIGRPITGATIHIVDEHLRQVPPGTAGEICIAGTPVALGYHDREELTRERFVATSYADRLYRTGDLGALGADGEIRYLGRLDDQFKVRGLRIEPQEVETALVSRAGLVDARVLPVAESSGDPVLAAVCVAADPPPRIQDIRQALGTVLPQHLVPSRYRFVDELPLTPAGKLDRRAAAALFQPAEETGSPTGADLLEQVRAAASAALGKAEIDVDADLFDLGATSFTMIRLAQLVTERTGAEVAVDLLLNGPTVQEIAAALAAPPAEPADAPRQADVRIAFDPEAKKKFKEARVAELSLPAELPRVPLPEPAAGDSLGLFDASAFRRFSAEPMPASALVDLLAMAAPGELGGLSKRRYPSAGGFYPVQVYVYVRPDRVDGLEGGLYYLHPAEGALVRLDPDLRVTEDCHVHHNRPLVGSAAFGVFLVSTPAAIAPAYGERLGAKYSELEAGHLSQLLMTAAPARGIGMCPVGDMDFDAVRERFWLDDDQDLLVSLWGGALQDDEVRRRAALAATPEEMQARQARRDEAAALDTVSAEPAGTGIPVAVIGFAARLPGADSLDGLGRLLVEGATAIGATPQERWSPLRTRSERAGARMGAYLDDITGCEAEEFGLDDKEAAATDPQERLLLATVRQCLEDAGSAGEQRARLDPIGVYVGAMWADHALHGMSARAAGEQGTHATRGGLAHRLSHAFDLTGPSMVVDSGCVSGMAAIDMAVGAIRSGRCRAAIAAASNLVLHPEHLDVLADLGLVAEDADSCAFTSRASGWLVGEGIGALMLKPLHRAVADGDPIHAVVRGTSVRHSGATRRYGVPSRGTQEEAVRAALADAGLPPESIGYVEAAAGGSALADALEAQELSEVFQHAGPVPLGSVKPTLGHLEAASVFAQLAKVMCQLRSGEVFATRLTSELNPAVVSAPAVEIPQERARWRPQPEPSGASRRRALVNGVAGTGSYGCLVIEEGPPLAEPQSEEQHKEAWALPLSADSPENLAVLANSLADAVPGMPLASVARTLREGRPARGERAVVVTTAEEAAQALRRLASAVTSGAGRLVGTATGELSVQIEKWLAGETVHWPEVERDVPKVSLPPTPLRVRDFRLPGAAPPSGQGAPPSGEGDGAASPLDRFASIVAAETGIPADQLLPETDLVASGVSSRRLLRIAARVAEEGGGPLALETLFETDNLVDLATAAFGGNP